MTAYQIKFTETEELASALKAIGADARSLPFFDNKREIKSLFLPRVDTRAANVVKQEMLSLGADAAVHAHAVDCRAESSDVLLFGTKKQLLAAADKLGLMGWWGFPHIASEIRSSLDGAAARVQPALLPSGLTLPFGERTLVMGIINLTDDSFYTGSRTCGCVDSLLKKALEFSDEGADIIDAGAESTRPGASRTPEAVELERVSTAVAEMKKALPSTPVSVDTTRASVARAALEAGADIINDISGLTYEPETAGAAAEYGAMLVLMHMRGTPADMQSMCDYDNLLLEITEFFDAGIKTAEAHGLDRSRIILDPGIGFAKTYDQNLFILRHLEAFKTFGLPVLIGASRKGTIGRATASQDVSARLPGTLAVSSLCAWQGVDIVRVHDVAENKKAVMMIDAIRKAQYA